MRLVSKNLVSFARLCLNNCGSLSDAQSHILFSWVQCLFVFVLRINIQRIISIHLDTEIDFSMLVHTHFISIKVNDMTMKLTLILENLKLNAFYMQI